MSDSRRDVKKMYSEDKSRKLWEICYGDHPNFWKIMSLLDGGADPNYVLEDDGINGSKWSCLISLIPGGCDKNKRECAKILIEYGAKVNQGDCKNYTPLMFCATNQDWETMELLLQHGANVNAADDDGDTALFYAENIECLKLLHKSGAVLDHVNLKGKTPFVSLMECASCFNMDEILYLIENGVNVNFKFKFDDDENREVTVMDCLERKFFSFPEQIQKAIQSV